MRCLRRINLLASLSDLPQLMLMLPISFREIQSFLLRSSSINLPGRFCFTTTLRVPVDHIPVVSYSVHPAGVFSNKPAGYLEPFPSRTGRRFNIFYIGTKINKNIYTLTKYYKAFTFCKFYDSYRLDNDVFVF